MLYSAIVANLSLKSLLSFLLKFSWCVHHAVSCIGNFNNWT